MVDYRAWNDYVASRLLLIKHMIDNEIITERGFNQKLLDDFGLHPKK